jgi:hypothetical protein
VQIQVYQVLDSQLLLLLVAEVEDPIIIQLVQVVGQVVEDLLRQPLLQLTVGQGQQVHQLKDMLAVTAQDFLRYTPQEVAAVLPK